MTGNDMDANNRTVVQEYFGALYGYVEEFREKMPKPDGERRQEDKAPQAPGTLVFPGNDSLGVRSGHFDISGIIEDYLEGMELERMGLEYAAGRMESDNGSLCRKFRAAPATPKYVHLVCMFDEDFRKHVDTRIVEMQEAYFDCCAAHIVHSRSIPGAFGTRSAWEAEQSVILKNQKYIKEIYQKLTQYNDSGFVLDAEAHIAGEKKLRALFPEIAEQWEIEMRQRFDTMLHDDPDGLYDDMMFKYAVRYVGCLGEELRAANRDLKAGMDALSEHENSAPSGFLKMVSLGMAGRRWAEKRDELAGGVEKSLAEVDRIEARRHEAESGCDGAVVCDWVESQIAGNHPELTEAYENYEQEFWTKKHEGKEESPKDRGEEDMANTREIGR